MCKVNLIAVLGIVILSVLFTNMLPEFSLLGIVAAVFCVSTAYLLMHAEEALKERENDEVGR